MDYEKLYKKTLERASKLRFQNPFDTVSQMVEYIFPELKESEDERIRKWIIDDIIYNMDNEPLNNSEYKKEAEKAIAWLEKQGQVNETIIPQHEDKTCKENNDSLTSEDERIRKAIIATIHLYYGEPLEDEAKEMIAWLEKQGNNVNIDIESMVSQYKQRLKSQGGVENIHIVDMCLTAFRHGVENVLEELNLEKLEKQGGQHE